jgi:hypothetical protein
MEGDGTMTGRPEPLPSDFGETLGQIRQLGITDEDAPQIRDRLIVAIAEQSRAPGDLAVGDLGFIEWSTRRLHRCEQAIHDQICEPMVGGLKEEYKDLLDKASSEENVNRIALIVTGALASVYPPLAVSSVIVYFTLWLLKVGLTYWCKQPVTALGQ